MGLYFRKSVNLGGGVRLNFSKSGVGISGGVKGARISTGPRGTYLNLSIPGTGIGYRTKLSGSNSTNRRTNNTRTTTAATTRYPYQQTVVNEYTGETRTIRAASRWELNEAVRNEQLRMQNNELRARRNAQFASQRERAEELTKEVKAVQTNFGHIIADTLNVNDILDWNKQYINEVYPEFKFDEPKPSRNKQGLLDKLFKKSDDYEARVKAYEERETKALEEYFDAKQKFETEKRQHNAEINFLKECFEACEESAIEKYVSVVLANSKYPDELEMDYDVDYVNSENAIYVSFLLPDKENFPLTDRYSYEQSTDTIKEIPLSKAKAGLLYENTLLAVGIRTIHELFEAIYNGAVNTVVFKGYLLISEEAETAEDTEMNEDIMDFSSNVREIFEIKADKRVFEGLTISDNNINETLKQLEFTRVKDFSNPSERL